MLEGEAIGRLVADPQLRPINKNGTAYNVCEFRLACQQRKNEVDFIKITAWRGMGDFIYSRPFANMRFFVCDRQMTNKYILQLGAFKGF